MSGLKPAVVGLIGASVISVGRQVFIPDGFALEVFKTSGTYVSIGILALALILSFKKVHPVIIIVLSAILGKVDIIPHDKEVIHISHRIDN